MKALERWLYLLVLGLPLLALLLHLVNAFQPLGLATRPWLAYSSFPALALLIYQSASTLWHKQYGVDLLAILAMVGALLMDEPATAAVIAAMTATGKLLDSYASGKAQREMTALLAKTPHTAHRLSANQLQSIPVEQIAPGDLLLIKQGETIPVDGPLLSETAILDESSLTGEALSVTRKAGALLLSGAINSGEAFQMYAARSAQDSTFQGIVRVVAQASQSRAPATRLANRYALWFIPFSLLLAWLAWQLSGDALRALAVLVVATPCPLLLAVPVALVSGMSQAARRGVLIKGSAALEQLAQADAVFFDKTGTLTGGAARLTDIYCFNHKTSEDELLRLAASLDQLSCHVIASAVLQAAHERRLSPLPMPRAVQEFAGAGMTGQIEQQQVCLGTLDFVLQHASAADGMITQAKRHLTDNTCVVYVALNGQLAGMLILADQLRLETPRALRMLRKTGVSQIAMLTGDKRDIAESIGAGIGVDQVYAELSPEMKLAHITQASREHCSMMIGDGVNDAPALAAAGVGVAMGIRGAAAAAESADIVLLTDRLDHLAEAKAIALRSLSIARQSVWIGMGCCQLAMCLAAVGLLAPIEGALAQELIDVAAILSALRALAPLPGQLNRQRFSPQQVATLSAEHQQLRPLLNRLSEVAAALPTVERPEQQAMLLALTQNLKDELLTHEQQDEQSLYPAVTRMLPGDDPLAALSHSHQQIYRQVRQLSQLTELYSQDGEAPTLQAIQRLLYGLDAILQLHFAQEEELFDSLQDS